MNKRLNALIVLILVIIVGVAWYFISSRPYLYVTGVNWKRSTWPVEVEGSVEPVNGIFKMMISQPSTNFFGASLIQQGDSPHGRWNITDAGLSRTITWDTQIADAQPALVIDFIGKRTSSIEWFDDNESNRANNIGILLVGDVGLGYYNPDTSTPRALFIDIWLDNNPQFNNSIHWQGVKNVENDYHSGYPMQSMPEIGKEYEFKFRVDTQIIDSLKHWNLTTFTLKMVQCYVEAKASRASIEVDKILITT